VSELSDRSDFEFEMVRRFGAKWAVLTAMASNMARKGIEVPRSAVAELRTSRIKIGSGCFSPCEVGCELSKVEGQIFSLCHLLNEEEFQQWCDLLAEAMQGKLDYDRVQGIPVLEPVKNDCRFLGCACSTSARG